MTSNLVRDVRRARLGFHILEAIRKNRPELMEKKTEALKLLTSSLTSVEPASGEYWTRALNIKKGIEKEIESLPKDVKASISAWVIPTGFYR